jgi:20S proteasome subunit alpha 6
MCTQHASRRPYGVGILLAGSDESGLHLYQLLPTGDAYECEGVGIGKEICSLISNGSALSSNAGSRSQAARTYLEKHRLTELSLDQVRLIFSCALFC